MTLDRFTTDTNIATATRSILRPHEGDTEWMDHANCKGCDPDLFHPTVNARHLTDQAKVVCAGCTVRDACLAYALANNEQHGIWGGTTAHDRRKMQGRRRRRGDGPFTINHGTESGYRMHRYAGIEQCDPCIKAHTAYNIAHRHKAAT